MTERKPRNAVVNSDGEILLYGVIGDWFDGLDAKSIIEAVKGLGEVDTLTIRINSGGGFVFEGLAVFNYLNDHKAKKVVKIDGLAASMASVIAMVGDEIIMPENALMMIHDPWNVVIGNADDLRKEAETLDKVKESLVSVYAKRTGKDAAEIETLMSDETWMTGAEAVDQGFATKVTDKVETAALKRASLAHLNLKNLPDVLRAAQNSAAAVAALNRADARNQEVHMSKDKTPADETAGKNGTGQEADAAATAAATEAARAEATKAERLRAKEIRKAVSVAKLDAAFADELVDADITLDQARAKIIDKLADKQEKEQPEINNKHRVEGGVDEREKFMQGASNWILARAPQARKAVEAHAKAQGQTISVDPGEFRGLSMIDLARMSLERQGVSTRGMDKRTLIGTALTFRNSITQGTSDFSVLLENVMHKILLAAYATTPDTWSRFCAVGSVSDFRAHNRYRQGTFGALDTVAELGEFKEKAIPDGAKETITAATKGNIINLSRQAIINDDMGAFNDIATRLGRSARLSIEVDVYALLAQNSGLGPAMNDGNTLFHASHNNVSTGAALAVDALDADRVLMASQKDPSGNEILDLRPAVLVLPIGLGGQARVINQAQFDVSVSSKFQVPNKVAGLFRDIVDTPRLTGTRRYLFADPAIAPTIEVAFLDGEQNPYLENKEGWRVDGVEWKVRLDYGVAAVDFRGAVTNAGA